MWLIIFIKNMWPAGLHGRKKQSEGVAYLPQVFVHVWARRGGKDERRKGGREGIRQCGGGVCK